MSYWTKLASDVRYVLVLALALALTAPVAMAEDTADWPQWGGPNRDFQAPSSDLTWPADGPEELWSRELGDGYSAILAKGDRLYTMYRDTEGKEAVIALDAATGKTVWETKYDAPLEKGQTSQFGNGPRATPLIDGDLIYTIGMAGTMHALKLSDGAIVWTQELWKEYGGTEVIFGYSSSPLVYGDTVIVLNGGEGSSIIAFNKADGSVVWKKHDFKNSYSAPQILEIDGETQLVTYMAHEVVGLDPATGDLRWRYEIANDVEQNISMPVLADDGKHLFISAVQTGSRGLMLTHADGEMQVEEAWTTRKIQLYHVTTVRQGDWVYGVTNNRAPFFMAAVNIKTGEIAWRERGFTKTQFVGAGDKIVALGEEGNLMLLSASPEGLERLGEATGLLEQPAWTAPTVVGDKVYLRNKKTIKALSLG